MKTVHRESVMPVLLGAAILLLFSQCAEASEVSVQYGKGVKHNPDTDSLGVSVVHGRYEYGVASINTALDKGFGRAFVMAHAARRFEVHKGPMFASISLGAALCRRTGDSTELAVAPYGSAFIGARRKGVSIGFGEWIVYRPNLSYPYEAGHGVAYHEAGERWNSPVFLGLRIGVELP